MHTEENPCCEVITIIIVSGFTSLTTLIEKEALLASTSLVHFSQRFLSRPLEFFSPSGEQQFIESEFKRVFSVDPMDVYFQKVSIKEVRKKISAANVEESSDIWSAVLLELVFKLLLEARHVRSEAIEADMDEEDEGDQKSSNDSTETEEFRFEEYFDSIYRLGFLTGRLISEYFIRNEIEPLAQLGKQTKEVQQKRTEQSGKVSSDKKHQRIDALLTNLEALFEENPALSRMHIEKTAPLAMQDALNQNPTLWRQGKGQMKEYIDEMRADLRYAKRFNALFEKTA